MLARDTLEGRSVALKIVPPEQAERLRWELELGSHLRHPHLPEMFELLVVEQAMGEPFHITPGSSVLVEEAIQGGTVEEWVSRAAEPLPTVLRLVGEVASALAAIHSLGWVHGDVKPANVLVRPDGSAVLVDFGLAGPPLDSDGRVRGTFGYLAPEAFTGARSVATDVYALGATLARLLGDDASNPIAADDTRPDAVRELIASMLQPDPADRLNDARTVIAAIEDVRRRLGEAVEPNVLPSRSSAELALRAQSLPWIGDRAVLASLVERLEQGGCTRVGGPPGAGRGRLVREAVRVFQRRCADAGRRVSTYVRADELGDPPAGPAILHLLVPPDDARLLAQQRAAAVAGHGLAVVIESEQGDVELGPLGREAFERLIAAILERVPDEAELERAYSATGGLAGRACTLASEAYARGEEPFARVEAGTLEQSDVVAWIARRGGSVRRSDIGARLDSITSLERAGLGWRSGDRFRLRRDVHRAALESLAVSGATRADDESVDEPVARAYMAACAGTHDAARLLVGVIHDALDRGDPREAERIGRDGATLLPEAEEIRSSLAEALRTQARYDDALAVLGDAHDAERAEILRRAGRSDEARAILDGLEPNEAVVTRALLLGDEKNAPAWTRAELAAWSALREERWDDALAQVRRGLESLAAKSGREARRARARLRSTEGSIAHAAGRPAEAVVAYELARRLASELGEAHLEATSAANAGAAQLDLGNLGAGAIAVEEGARRLLRLGRDRDAARALVNLASGTLWIGDDARAARAAEQAELAAERASDAHAAAHAWLVGLELALRRGRIERARTSIARAPADGRVRARAAALWAAHDSVAARALLGEGDPFSRAIALARLQLAEGEAPSGSITLSPSTWEERLQLGLLELDLSEGDPHRSTRARARLREHLDRAAETLTPAQRRMMRRVASYARAWATMPAADAAREDGRWRRLVDRTKRLTAERRVRRIREMVVQTAVELVDAERGFWVERRSDGELRIVARDAWDETAESEVSRSVVSRAMDAQRTVRAVDALEDERLRGALSVHAMALRSVLCVPLRHGSAVLYLDDRLRPAAFDDEDARLLEDLADLASIALAGAERLRSERSAVRRLERARRDLQERVEAQAETLEGLRRSSGVVALSASMRRTMELVSRVASTDAPLMLGGESGVGKERIAHAVHAMSPRRDGPFIPVACAAIPENLLESTLFGHERGAFTGATDARRGVFEMAEGGTLFLDEIGEMSRSMQAKLLRVVQEGELRRVGSETVRATDVRIVTATHRDLRAMIDQDAFREDLYYRLAVVHVDVPPLRERLEDLPRLVESMLVELDAGHVKPSAEAMAQLMSHAWPGNVRELRNVLERALVTAEDAIRAEDLGLGREQSGWDLKSELEALERRLIRGAMHETGGNQTKAAELLGVSRYGLQKKLKRLDL